MRPVNGNFDNPYDPQTPNKMNKQTVSLPLGPEAGDFLYNV